MDLTMATIAARNNAAWCDAVCRAQGRSGMFTDILWFNPLPAPRFYPDFVTLDGLATGAQLEAIRRLVAVERARRWTVKDSFHSLDLTPLGFRPLFDAQWISCWAAAAPVTALSWQCVVDSAELAAWSDAWSGSSAGEAEKAVFTTALLDDPDVALVAARTDGAVVGGGALNRAAGAVGVSNFFAAGPEAGEVWRGLVAQATARFPGLPVVGYETGAALDAALAVGFERIGPLRIWARP